MKILFIENRNKTLLYDGIVKFLAKKYEVEFLVYNKLFHSKLVKNNFVYIKKKKNKRVHTSSISKILSADRGINYFNLKSNYHIFDINESISEILDKTNPDIIFGESTLLHEQLVINWAKANNILYLHPTSTRYPPGRMVFLKYDTMLPFGGSTEETTEDELSEIIQKIIENKLKPSYMKKIGISKFSKLFYALKISYGNLFYDKFLTPSVLIKLKLEFEKKRNIAAWDNFAFDNFDKERDQFYILYPLQMQPEMNIDYWGYPYSNQVNFIKQILENSDEKTKIVVKPNPKSKYEMSAELVHFVKSNPRIIPLAHSVKMEDIFKGIELVVTNTGTIALESFFKEKPCIVLGNFFSKFIKKNTFNDIHKFKNDILNNNFVHTTNDQKKIFLDNLIKTSYKGNIGDPYLTPEILESHNISLVTIAFEDIIKKHAYSIVD